MALLAKTDILKFLEELANAEPAQVDNVQTLDAAIRVRHVMTQVDWSPIRKNAGRENEEDVDRLVAQVETLASELEREAIAGPVEEIRKIAGTLVSTCIRCHVAYAIRPRGGS